MQLNINIMTILVTSDFLYNIKIISPLMLFISLSHFIQAYLVLHEPTINQLASVGLAKARPIKIYNYIHVVF